MTSTSTQPSVMIALLEKFAGLTFPTMLGSGEPVYVFDGDPGQNQPDSYIQVGGTQDPAISGGQVFAGLGATVKYEDYVIDCAVSCYVGGNAATGWGSTDTATSTQAQSDAQLSARTNAYAIFAQIEQAMISDIQLQNVANPVDPTTVLWTEIIPKTTQQTSAADPESDKGRICNIFFDIRVHGRIFP